MTVLQNIRAGAGREPDKKKREAAVAAVMDCFGLTPLANHLPSQLSGGQQQRTALARILVSNPRILLLDEPFSALDNHLRFRLEQEVRQTIAAFGKTVLLVSHDRDEVFRLADSIAVVSGGTIDAFGGKAEVFRNPQTRMGAMLTGCKNISSIETLDATHIRAADWRADAGGAGGTRGCESGGHSDARYPLRTGEKTASAVGWWGKLRIPSPIR